MSTAAITDVIGQVAWLVLAPKRANGVTRAKGATLARNAESSADFDGHDVNCRRMWVGSGCDDRPPRAERTRSVAVAPPRPVRRGGDSPGWRAGVVLDRRPGRRHGVGRGVAAPGSQGRRLPDRPLAGGLTPDIAAACRHASWCRTSPSSGFASMWPVCPPRVVDGEARPSPVVLAGTSTRQEGAGLGYTPGRFRQLVCRNTRLAAPVLTPGFLAAVRARYTDHKASVPMRRRRQRRLPR